MPCQIGRQALPSSPAASVFRIPRRGAWWVGMERTQRDTESTEASDYWGMAPTKPREPIRRDTRAASHGGMLRPTKRRPRVACRPSLRDTSTLLRIKMLSVAPSHPLAAESPVPRLRKTRRSTYGTMVNCIPRYVPCSVLGVLREPVFSGASRASRAHQGHVN